MRWIIASIPGRLAAIDLRLILKSDASGGLVPLEDAAQFRHHRLMIGVIGGWCVRTGKQSAADTVQVEDLFIFQAMGYVALSKECRKRFWRNIHVVHFFIVG